jgi:WD40 repeat protein
MAQAYPESVLRGHKGEVQCICFQQDGDILYSGDSEGVVRAWKLATARSTQCEAHSSNAGVIQVQILGVRILGTQGRDGEVKLWTLRPEGALEYAGCLPGSGYHFCKFHSQQLHSVPDGPIPTACMVTFDSDACAFQLWDLRDRKHSMTVNLGKEYGQALCVQLAALEQPALICGSEGGCVVFWDLRNTQTALARLSLGTDPCFALSCKANSCVGPPVPAPDTKKNGDHSQGPAERGSCTTGCNSGGDEGELNTNGPNSGRPDSGHAVAMPVKLASEATVLAGTGDQVVWISLDSRCGTLDRLRSCSLPQEGVGDICIRDDGRIATVATWEGTTRIYHVRTGKQLAVLKHHKRAVTAASFQPGGKCLATAGRDRVIALWNIPEVPRNSRRSAR